MNPCKRVGLDITWRCNCSCRHCFYRRNSSLHRPQDVPLSEVITKVNQAITGGLDHAVMVGYGEPTLAITLPDILNYCHERNVATSIITNGATGLSRIQSLVRLGIDHLHISSHGLGDTADRITGQRGTFAKQSELKAWLASESIPFRTNVTIQRENYRELPDLADYEISCGVFHFVLLGFLPHYEWQNHTCEVAVSPAELRPYIEDAAERLLNSETLFTIRYHPLCHLSPKYWPYVVNARYVFFDPWEWNYSLQAHDREALWRDSMRLGESVANTRPCNECSAYRHCGGWNKTYADAFGGAGLAAITEPPTQYLDIWDTDGGLHDLNPANGETGTIRPYPPQ